MAGGNFMAPADACEQRLAAARQLGRERALAEVRGKLIVREMRLSNARSAVVRAQHKIEDVLAHPDEFGTRKLMLEHAVKDLQHARDEIEGAR